MSSRDLRSTSGKCGQQKLSGFFKKAKKGGASTEEAPTAPEVTKRHFLFLTSLTRILT
jgi:hypothetical protein